MTTIFITHDQEEANSISDRMAVLHKDAIQQIGRPQDLYDQPANRFAARFLGSANVPEGWVETRARRCALSPARARHRPCRWRWGRDRSRSCCDRRTSPFTDVGPDTIRGQVLHRGFPGSQIRYFLQAAGSNLVIDKSHHSSEVPVAIGAEVALVLNMDSVVLLSAGRTGQPRPRGPIVARAAKPFRVSRGNTIFDRARDQTGFGVPHHEPLSR